MNTVFKDLKVIELASVLAGPAVGMFFAELGATVIKVENKTTNGDVTRNWRLAKENQDRNYSAYYCSVNWQKKTLFYDLRQAADYQQLLTLIKTADVVISNYRVTSAKKMKLDYAHLKQIKPNLIYAELSGFGSDSTRAAFDIVLQAEAGFLYMTGDPKGEIARLPVALIDLMAAHQLKEGILIALLERYKTGKGSYLHVSLLEAALASLANQATNWLMEAHIPTRMGCLHPNIAPYGEIFLSKDDKMMVLAIGTEKQFVELCRCLGAPALATNPLFKTNQDRVTNRNALKEKLTDLFVQFEREPLLTAFHESGVPAGSIRNMKEVFELEIAQRMILTEKMEDGTISKRLKTVAFTRMED